jgi:cephalosporin hydroxylase
LAELFWRLKPDVIVETGVYHGGSSLLFASLCRLHGKGRVISIDREFPPGVREAIQERGGGLVTMIKGDSSRHETALEVRQNIGPHERVCVFLDSDHSLNHVSSELQHLSPLVTEGCYLIVADSIMSELVGTPLGKNEWSWDNPGEAVDKFLASHPAFCRDQPSTSFKGAADFRNLSYFPQTWLRRL